MSNPFSDPSSRRFTTSLSQTFGAAGQQGESGERVLKRTLEQFARTVAAHHDSPNAYLVRHSLSMPRGLSDRERPIGDVDFAVASGDHLVLIDAKLWKPGFYYSQKLPPKKILELFGGFKYTSTARWLSKNVLGRTLGFRGIHLHIEGKWLLSQNMEMALERYRERLTPHRVQVSAMVVFVPTRSESLFQSVALLRWPGGIRTFDVPGGREELYRLLGSPEPVNPAIITLLEQMKR